MPGSQIGKNFEREVVRNIRDAFSFMKVGNQDCFRTPMSGGHHALPGVDIQMSDRLFAVFPYAIECKNTKKFYCGAMMSPRKNELDWGRQAVKSARGIKGSVPLLVMKDKHIGVFCALPFRDRPQMFAPTSELRFVMLGGEWVMYHWGAWLDYVAGRVELQLRKGKQK